MNPCLQLLKLDGTMVLVGALTALDPMIGFNVIAGRKSVAGSGIGGMAETQEMIDFRAAKNIVSDVDMIRIEDVNAAYERLLKNDVLSLRRRHGVTQGCQIASKRDPCLEWAPGGGQGQAAVLTVCRES